MENLNIFGKNQEEIGSLDKNLVLRTQGRVYIRFGRKYIELIDDKGNINAKIPKVLTKVNSKDNIKGTGFFLLDEDLYASYEDEIIQITGVDGKFLSYGIEQDLTQEDFDIAQKNIGLKFKTLKDAQKSVTEGIVFIGDKLYYTNKGISTELFVLNTPISSINNSNLGTPSKNVSAIVFKDGNWIYDQVVTLEYFNKYIRPTTENEKTPTEKQDAFDLIEYSKRYNLTKFEFEYNEESEEKIVSSATFDTTPSYNLQDGDICIVTLIGYLGDLDAVSQKKTELLKEEAVVLYFKYENEKLKLTDKNGNPCEITLKSDSNGEFQYFEYDGKRYSFIGTIQENLDQRKTNLYVKTEQSNPKKFKLDYQNAEIALEENYINETIPHTVLGDLTDEAGNYNNIPFKTFTDRDNTQGLYSDQAVFNGVEFRGEYPDEGNNIGESYNYPRYSDSLNGELIGNHKLEDIEDGDPFESVVPTIGWIKENGLKSPLKEINTLDSKAPGDGYVIISTGEESWDFYDLNEFKEEIIQQCEEMISSSMEQINQAIEQVNQAIEELKAAASSSESSGGESSGGENSGGTSSGGEGSGTSTTG